MDINERPRLSMDFGEKQFDKNVYHLDGDSKYVVTTNHCVIIIRNSVDGTGTQVAVLPNENTERDVSGVHSFVVRVKSR